MRKPLKLLPHQYTLLQDDHTKILGMTAGYGSGKTYSAARKAVDLALKNPGHDGIITEPNFPLLTQILIPELKTALEFYNMEYEYKAGESIFYVNINGLETRIICKSMESYERLIGINAAWVIMDEFDTAKTALAYNAFIKLLGRIRVGHVRQMVIVSTPEGYKAMYKIFVEEADDNKRLIRAKTTDNHHLPQDYIDTMRSQYPPELIDAYLNGEFTNLTSGTVYTQFDRTLNDTSMDDDMMSDLHIGIDFNVSAMSAIVHLVKDQCSFAIAEYVDLFDTPELVEVLTEAYRGRNVIVYPDAAGNARKTVQASQSDINLLKQAGFTVRANSRNPSIIDRVNGLNSMFCNANRERRAFVNTNNCPKYTKALEQQAYDEATNMPDKKNGHDNKGIDAAGYFHSFLFPVRAVIRSKHDRPQQTQTKQNWSPFDD
jgi:PBSX family phage terminase large subunit